MPLLATDPLRLKAMPWKVGVPGMPSSLEIRSVVAKL
jgi:hypothetical protein